MYIPASNQFEDNEQILGFIRKYSFASIVTSIDQKPIATHLPFHLAVEEGRWILSSHFAKANDHWKHIEHENNLIIFSEPHAYISPSHYESKLSVPTWNYVAVHLYGTCTIKNDFEEKLRILENTIQFYEPAFLQQWQHLPSHFKLGMMEGIVAFQMEVSEVQAKKKVSQNKNLSEQKSIINTLSESEFSHERDIAAFMESNKNYLHGND